MWAWKNRAGAGLSGFKACGVTARRGALGGGGFAGHLAPLGGREEMEDVGNSNFCAPSSFDLQLLPRAFSVLLPPQNPSLGLGLALLQAVALGGQGPCASLLLTRFLFSDK